MKNVLKYFYIFLWLFVIPIIIGMSVGDGLVKMYDNFDKHWVAGLCVCFFSGAVVTWFPMFFIIEETPYEELNSLYAFVVIGWPAGSISPLIFGFKA